MQAIVPVERMLTASDHLRLRHLRARHPDAVAAEALDELLATSDLVAGTDVPVGLVTLGSRVLLQDTDRAAAPYQLTLCEPQDARPAAGCISVLSPVGSALLGLRAGQVARWRTPLGREGAALVLSVLFQPQAEVR
jgi:regulator of nucleoside diphosphate kinase